MSAGYLVITAGYHPDEEVSGRRTHDLWRRAAHLQARSELRLAHMAAACPHHFSADSLFHGLCPCAQSSEAKQKCHKHDKKFVSSLRVHSLAITFFLFNKGGA